MNGKETTPANEAKVREARKKIGDAESTPDDKQETDELLSRDEIINSQVEGGRLNLNKVESRIAEFESHQRVELHQAVIHRLNSKVLPKLLAFEIRAISDLQTALHCLSKDDLVQTCEKLLKISSPSTPEGYETSDILKSIGNLNALEDIFVEAFKLNEEDNDFHIKLLHDDPEAAFESIRVAKEIDELNGLISHAIRERHDQ